MGRPQAPLAAGSGAGVEEFAAGLRQLRVESGQPTYRKMAKATHYSAATLARAASGHALPSLDVTLAYVAACGGDGREWRSRWERVRRLHRNRTPAPAGDAQPDAEPGPEPAEGDGPAEAPAEPEAEVEALAEPAPTARPLRRVLVRIAWVLGAVSVAANVVLWWTGHQDAATGRSPVVVVSPPPVTDGTDPKVSGCVDATSLDPEPVALGGPATLGGRKFPAGTVIGRVTLRYSVRCAGAWARFDPVIGIVTSPTEASVTIGATRPADGTQTSFHLGRFGQMYSDLLLTGRGCVSASVVVTSAAGTVLGSARTGCLPRP